MNKTLVIAAIVSSIFAHSVFAQAAGCRYNGQLYAVGAKLGNWTCTAGGTWK